MYSQVVADQSSQTTNGHLGAHCHRVLAHKNHQSHNRRKRFKLTHSNNVQLIICVTLQIKGLSELFGQLENERMDVGLVPRY